MKPFYARDSEDDDTGDPELRLNLEPFNASMDLVEVRLTNAMRRLKDLQIEAAALYTLIKMMNERWPESDGGGIKK